MKRMPMTRWRGRVGFGVGLVCCLALVGSFVLAGDYRNSIHGSATSGVDRSSIDSKFLGFSKGNCIHCHEQHASLEGAEPIPVGGAASVALGFATEQNLCYECHDGTPVPPAVNSVKSQFTTLTYRHGKNGATGIDYMTTYDNLHKPGEKTSTDYSGANRHSECVDCHNPHTLTTANPLQGATGIAPTNSAAWAEPTFPVNTTAVTNRLEQYKVCFKCHSGWAGVGTGTSQALEFNTLNRGFHNIEGAATPPASTTYGNFNTTYVARMMPRYAAYTNAQLRSVAMICSDCHGNTDAAAVGVHGSVRPSILKVPDGSPYTTWDNTISIANRGTCWCFNCHDPNFTNSGFSGVDGELHVGKHNKTEAKCMSCHVKIPHGWNLLPRLVKPYNMSATYSAYQGTTAASGVNVTTTNWKASGTWTENAAGTPHQNCN